MDSSGNLLWDSVGIAICDDTTNVQGQVLMVSDGRSGVIVTWTDSRSGNSDIYSQRIDSLGICQWDTNGLPVCEAPMTQMLPSICGDGQGGAIISWQDKRGGATTANVYAQRVGNVEGVEEKKHIRHRTGDIRLTASPNPFTTATTIILTLPSSAFRA